MDALESLAKRNHRDGDFWDYLRADQRSPAEDSAIESPRFCSARSSVDGFNRGDDAGARVPCNPLRQSVAVARDNADIRVPLSRAFFRMGSRRRPGLFAHAAAAIALSDTHVGNPICVARNDTVCLMLTPLVVVVIRRGKLPLLPYLIALATTFAGNLTIIGSVANMIVVKSAREHLQVGFWDYALFGIPITILTTSAGILALLALH